MNILTAHNFASSVFGSAADDCDFIFKLPSELISGSVEFTPIQKLSQPLLDALCPEAGIPRLTWHGFRAGGSIEAALSGASIEQICDHIDWADPRMARYYMKIVDMLSPSSIPNRLAAHTSTDSSGSPSRQELLVAVEVLYPLQSPQNVSALAALTSDQ